MIIATTNLLRNFFSRADVFEVLIEWKRKKNIPLEEIRFWVIWQNLFHRVYSGSKKKLDVYRHQILKKENLEKKKINIFFSRRDFLTFNSGLTKTWKVFHFPRRE